MKWTKVLLLLKIVQGNTYLRQINVGMEVNQWSLRQWAFAAHIIIEVPATLNFFFRPSSTLAEPQRAAHGVIRQYSIALLSTIVIAAALLKNPHNELASIIAFALGMYHTAPLVRAMNRIRSRATNAALGGPWLHTAMHTLCLGLFIAVFLEG